MLRYEVGIHAFLLTKFQNRIHVGHVAGRNHAFYEGGNLRGIDHGEDYTPI